MSKKKIVIGVVALAVAAFAGGGAYAATQSNPSPRQAFLDDVAKHLGVTPAQLDSAFKAALVDRLDAAVKAGAITQAQADRIKRRIEAGAVPLFFGRPHAFRLRARARRTMLGAAASYLGVSEAQLLADLRGGQTLAQVAKAQGKSVTGLEQAMTAAIKARLDKAVASGLITKARENRILSRLQARVARRINRPLPRFGEFRGAGRGRAFAPMLGPPPGPPGAPPPPPA